MICELFARVIFLNIPVFKVKKTEIRETKWRQKVTCSQSKLGVRRIGICGKIYYKQNSKYFSDFLGEKNTLNFLQKQ